MLIYILQSELTDIEKNSHQSEETISNFFEENGVSPNIKIELDKKCSQALKIINTEDKK